MSKKLVSEPIFVNNINELKETITKYNRHQKVSYNCCICNKLYTATIDAILKRIVEPTCSKCSSHQTSLKHYGVEHHLQLKDQLEKQQATNLKKYGSKFPNSFSTEKFKNSIREKYGVENVFQSEEIKDKIKQTCLERYGDTSCARNAQVRNKYKETCLIRYGVENTFQSKDLMKDAILTKNKNANGSPFGKRYIYNNIRFDSSWELKMYIYLIDHKINFKHHCEPIEYTFNGKTHFYFPDFILPCGIIEIKGDQFFKNDGTLYCPYNKDCNDIYAAKQKCMEEHNVIVLTRKDLKNVFKYVDLTYGKDYVKKFKNM